MYVEEGEDLDVAAARELLEETGWRPARVEHLVTFQPMVGSADSANPAYAAYDCVQTDEAIDINEAVEVRWVPLHEASEMVKTGEVVSAASVVAIGQLESAGRYAAVRTGARCSTSAWTCADPSAWATACRKSFKCLTTRRDVIPVAGGGRLPTDHEGLIDVAVLSVAVCEQRQVEHSAARSRQSSVETAQQT